MGLAIRLDRIRYSTVWMDAKVLDRRSGFYGHTPGFTHQWVHQLEFWWESNLGILENQNIRLGGDGNYQSEYYEAVRNAPDQKHKGYFCGILPFNIIGVVFNS